MKISICIILLFLLANTEYAQRVSPRDAPQKDTAKTGSTFLDAIVKGILNEKQKRDSLNKYFREHPMETNTYVSHFLVDRWVLPNDDAINLIKALNPHIKGVKEINYYAELRLPVFKRLQKPDRRRLRKECSKLDKYDANASRIFISRLSELETTNLEFSNSKIRSNAKSSFGNVINEIRDDLTLLKNKRLPKGITVFLTEQLSTLNQVVTDVIKSSAITQMQQEILKEIRANTNYPSLKKIGFSDPNRVKQYKNSLIVAGSDFENADEFSSNSTTAAYSADWLGEADISSKICAIYAKTVDTTGNRRKDADIDLQYFFSFETAIEAKYKCKTGTCGGFIEQNGLVSANGANIIPSNYVFRFRDKGSNQVYFRCISKEMFEKIQSNSSNGNNRKFRIIFFPGQEECKAFMPH